MPQKEFLQTCNACREDFDPSHFFVVKAKRCPRCGTPVPATKSKTYIEIMIAATLILLTAAGVAAWVVL
jgi:uncharacterized paraquat-inducible protein A